MDGLEQLRDQGLERVALHRQSQAQGTGQDAGMTGGGEGDVSGSDRPRDVSTPTTRSPAVRNPVTSQPWIRSTPKLIGRRAKAQAT